MTIGLRGLLSAKRVPLLSTFDGQIEQIVRPLSPTHRKTHRFALSVLSAVCFIAAAVTATLTLKGIVVLSVGASLTLLFVVLGAAALYKKREADRNQENIARAHMFRAMINPQEL